MGTHMTPHVDDVGDALFVVDDVYDGDYIHQIRTDGAMTVEDPDDEDRELSCLAARMPDGTLLPTRDELHGTSVRKMVDVGLAWRPYRLGA